MLPSTIILIEDIITPLQEQEIISHIPSSLRRKVLGRNSIHRYGKNPYNNALISSTIPPFLTYISDMLVEKGILISPPDSITINEYRPNQSLSYHIDSKDCGPIITILSLLSPATLLLRKGSTQHSLPLPSRSLLQLSGEARWDWEHAIEKVPYDRYSVVFRQTI